jgi:hypothetical protein
MSHRIPTEGCLLALPYQTPAGELDVAMMANRDGRVSRSGVPPARTDGETSYELVAVCLGSVFGVVVVALLIWLALGGKF